MRARGITASPLSIVCILARDTRTTPVERPLCPIDRSARTGRFGSAHAMDALPGVCCLVCVGMKKTNAQKESEKKAKEAAKTAASGPAAKELTHAQIKERDGAAMRAKQAVRATHAHAA